MAWGEPIALPVAWVVLIAVFGGIEPGRFLTVANAGNILGSQAVLFVLTMAILPPLMNGDFDLSLAYVATLVAMWVAVLNVQNHVPIGLACVIGLGIGLICGLVNAFVVVRFNTNSFIVTLGTGTAYLGLVYAISASNTISGLPAPFSQWIFGLTVLGIPVEFYYGLGTMLIVGYVFTRTTLGQKMLFTGQSREVARLSGVRTGPVRVVAFAAGGLMAAIAGIMYIGTTGAADPVGPSALGLASFAAAFLGATSIRPGRFNVWGAAIAVWFLATGAAGLELLGMSNFVQNLFYGVALVVAVVASQVLRKRAYGSE